MLLYVNSCIKSTSVHYGIVLGMFTEYSTYTLLYFNYKRKRSISDDFRETAFENKIYSRNYVASHCITISLDTCGCLDLRSLLNHINKRYTFILLWLFGGLI